MSKAADTTSAPNPNGSEHPLRMPSAALEPLGDKAQKRSRRRRVTEFAPTRPVIQPRLLSLQQAAEYTSLSYWTLRDLVLTNQIPTVPVPLTRVNDGGRRGEHRELPPHRVLVDPTDPRIAGRSTRRILIDRADLDAWIDQQKERRR
jgi:hypothetical protein